MSKERRIRPFIARARLPLALWLSLLLGVLSNHAADTPTMEAPLQGQFDQANKLYEEGQYAKAAAAYQSLLEKHPSSPTLHFNQGNCWFKSGELGRAIAAYRLAQRQLPRDPAVRFNLSFARKQLVGQPPPQLNAWQTAVTRLTIDEWTLLTTAAYWLFMVLLILRELHPPLARPLRIYAILAGALILLPLTGLGLNLTFTSQQHEAVIVVSNAKVRRGPLAESQTHFQLRDGAEVQVLDHKQIEETMWLQIEDTTGRTGWISNHDVIELHR